MSRHRIAQWMAVAVVGFAVSSAKADVIIDLTTAGSTSDTATNGPIDNGMRVFQVNPQSTGTGVISPFLRIQSNNLERGYNTDASNPPLDAKGGTHTHSLFVGQLAPVQIGGVGDFYYRFLLDVNQLNNDNNNANLLTLTEFQIYTGNTAFPTGDPEGNNAAQKGTFATATLRYDLDGTTDYGIDMNGTLNPGSGAGDYFFFVPVSVLAGASATDFFYLYTSFGRNGGGSNRPYQSNDGFEEWAALLNPLVPPPDTNPVPAPPALVLGLVGAAGLFGRRALARRRKPVAA